MSPALAPMSSPGRLPDRLAGLATRLALAGLGLLPEARGVRLGAWLGRVLRVASPRRAEVARTNLRIAFPEWSEAQRERVLREAFVNLGRGVVEVAQIRRLSVDAVRARTVVEGLEQLEAARRASPSGGVIVLTGHFGNWELLATAMAARGLPVSLVHRARDNPHLERVITAWRARCGLEVMERGSAARAVLRALRAGRIVALPLDQNTSPREGIFVPFFHRLACTRDGPARIALRTGAPVVPVFIFRTGVGHTVRVGEALDLVPAGDDRDAAVRENVRRMNLVFERVIRAEPAQWSWTHRRWKSQPPGEPRTYRSRREPGAWRALLVRRRTVKILTN